MNYTTIEQSKKLLELGLNPNTADMVYWMGEYITHSYSECQHKEEQIPIWSVGALLELMPLSIVGWDNETYARYFIGNCAEYATGTSKYDKGLISIPSDSMFKCVYSMVCWLLQNNYIKTE